MLPQDSSLYLCRYRSAVTEFLRLPIPPAHSPLTKGSSRDLLSEPSFALEERPISRQRISRAISSQVQVGGLSRGGQSRSRRRSRVGSASGGGANCFQEGDTGGRGTNGCPFRVPMARKGGVRPNWWGLPGDARVHPRGAAAGPAPFPSRCRCRGARAEGVHKACGTAQT